MASVVKSRLSLPSVGGLANDKEGKKQFLDSEELRFVSNSVLIEITLSPPSVQKKTILFNCPEINPMI